MVEGKVVRALIVDDEGPARRLVREYLGGFPWVQVVGEAASGAEAVRLEEELEPDLLFLDIQMPKIDGFEVLGLLRGRPKIVFITAFDEYAVRAFEVNALDYLMKPLSRERFVRAMEKFEAQGPEPAAKTPAELARALYPNGTYRSRLVARDGAEVIVIPVEEVDYLQAQDDYVEAHYSGRSQLLSQALRDLERELDPREFVRVHRSYIVPVAKVARIEPWGAGSKRIVLKNGSQVPLSRAGETRLKGVFR